MEMSNYFYVFVLQELFERVAVEAQPRLKEFSPQNLSNLSWSFATMDSK